MERINKVIDYLQGADLIAAILGIILCLVLLSLWHFHRDRKRTNFDLTDLLMENGRISKISVVMVGSFFITSWMMVHMTINQRMTEGYLGIYVAAWIAPVVTRLFKVTPNVQVSNNNAAPPPQEEPAIVLGRPSDIPTPPPGQS